MTLARQFSAGQDYPAAASLVKDVSGLVSPPDVCLSIFQLMRSASATARDFGEVIGRDPNLTARLLRVANSSFYGFSGRVETVSRAVTVIGLQQLYSVVIAVSAVSSFNKMSSSLINMDSFWRHSVFSGLVSKHIAQQARALHPERLFVAGLMHDIGSLIIFNQLPELAESLPESSDGDENLLYEYERDALGYSHADVGSLLLTLWGLPPTLHGAVRGHHDPQATTVGKQEACIVLIANKLADQHQQGMSQDVGNPAAGPSEADWAAIGLTTDSVDVSHLVAEVEDQFSDTVELIAAGR